MRFALLLPNNINTAPYLTYYVSVLESQGVSYDILFWDRTGAEKGNKNAFPLIPQHRYPWNKFIDYYRFSNFLKKKIKSRRYDRIIVFTPQLGIFLQRFLFKRFRNTYILDIRDYSAMIRHFRNRLTKTIMHSRFTALSSPGFKSWLPDSGKYSISHNVGLDLLEEQINSPGRDKNYFKHSPATITTIGQIKDFESDSKFVEVLCNNNDYVTKFIGYGPSLEALKAHAGEMSCSNIYFHGPYEKKEERNLLKETDLINILISRNELNKGKTLLSNRLYLSALYRIPCIVNTDTAQSEIVRKYKLGIVVDHYEELPEKIEEFIMTFDSEQFAAGSIRFLKTVRSEVLEFQRHIRNFCKPN